MPVVQLSASWASSKYFRTIVSWQPAPHPPRVRLWGSVSQDHALKELAQSVHQNFAVFNIHQVPCSHLFWSVLLPLTVWFFFLYFIKLPKESFTQLQTQTKLSPGTRRILSLKLPIIIFVSVPSQIKEYQWKSMISYVFSSQSWPDLRHIRAVCLARSQRLLYFFDSVQKWRSVMSKYSGLLYSVCQKSWHTPFKWITCFFLTKKSQPGVYRLS